MIDNHQSINCINLCKSKIIHYGHKYYFDVINKNDFKVDLKINTIDEITFRESMPILYVTIE